MYVHLVFMGVRTQELQVSTYELSNQTPAAGGFMALVVLTLHDEEDGTFSLNATAEPFIPGPEDDTIPTPAQTASLIAVSAIAQAIGQDLSAGGNDEEAPAERPSLEIVGNTD